MNLGEVKLCQNRVGDEDDTPDRFSRRSACIALLRNLQMCRFLSRFKCGSLASARAAAVRSGRRLLGARQPAGLLSSALSLADRAVRAGGGGGAHGLSLLGISYIFCRHE